MSFVVGTLSAPITLDDTAFNAGLSEVNKAGETAAQQVGKSFKDIGKTMGDVGKSLTTRLTLPIAGVSAAIGKIGMDFDTQMSKVEAISGATGSELDKLREKAQEMGSMTMFSASQSAEALEYMALAGWTTQQMLDGLPGVLDLAAAGSLDLGRASDIVTDGMSMFQMDASDAARMSDVLAAAQSNANTNVEQLGEAFKMGGATAAAAGQDIEQTSAILGILADNGFKGSQAGTILDNMFRDLRQSAEDGAIAVGDANIALYDAEGNMRPLADIMADVEKATDGMTGAQRDQALASVFQSRSMRGVNALLGTGTDAVYGLEDALYGAEGFAREAADTMQDNLGGSLTELKSALEGAAISLYELGQGPIRSLVDWITGLVRSFIDMDDQTKQIIAIVGLLVAAIGPLLIVLGLVVSSIGSLIPLFAALFSPVTLIIGAIAALTAGIVYLWNTNETFRDIVVGVWDTISNIISTAVGFIVEFAKERLDMLQQFWTENGQAIMEAVQNAFNIISTIITTVMNVIWEIMQFIWPAIRALIITTWEAIKGVIDGALNFIMGLINTFAGLFTGDFSRMWEGIKQMFSGALQFLWNAIQLYFVGRIIGVARSFIGLLRNALTNMWTNIRTLFTNSLSAIRNGVQSVLNGIRNIWLNVWDAIFSFIRNILTNTRNTVANSFNTIRSTITNVINAVRNVITTVLNAIRNAFSNIFSSVRNVVSTAINGVRNTIRNGIEGALNIITGMGRRFMQAGRNIVTSIADGIKNAIGTVTGAIGSVMDSVRNFLPFSPAKEGPLKDLGKLDFGSPIEESIEKAMPKIDRAMEMALNVPSVQTANGGSASITNNYRGMLEGAVFNVREEADIKKLAREFYKLKEDKRKPQGRG